jgi:hypothetical protein
VQVELLRRHGRRERTLSRPRRCHVWCWSEYFWDEGRAVSVALSKIPRLAKAARPFDKLRAGRGASFSFVAVGPKENRLSLDAREHIRKSRSITAKGAVRMGHPRYFRDVAPSRPLARADGFFIWSRDAIEIPARGESGVRKHGALRLRSG